MKVPKVKHYCPDCDKELQGKDIVMCDCGVWKKVGTTWLFSTMKEYGSMMAGKSLKKYLR